MKYSFKILENNLFIELNNTSKQLELNYTTL